MGEIVLRSRMIENIYWCSLHNFCLMYVQYIYVYDCYYMKFARSVPDIGYHDRLAVTSQLWSSPSGVWPAYCHDKVQACLVNS